MYIISQEYFKIFSTVTGQFYTTVMAPYQSIETNTLDNIEVKKRKNSF